NIGAPVLVVATGHVVDSSGLVQWARWRMSLRFVDDSPLEESGLEPLVPATWTTRSRPSVSPSLLSHSCLRDQLVHREGPTVRIRFPPAASQHKPCSCREGPEVYGGWLG